MGLGHSPECLGPVKLRAQQPGSPPGSSLSQLSSPNQKKMKPGHKSRRLGGAELASWVTPRPITAPARPGRSGR